MSVLTMVSMKRNEKRNLASVAQSEDPVMAFCPSVFSVRRIHVSSKKISIPTCSAARSNPSRRRFLREALLTITGASLHPTLRTNAAEKPTKLESAVVPVVMCRTIMTPVGRYIEEGSWDKGRTNVNYCKNQLAMRLRMREVAEQLGGDAFYDGMDIMGEMVNTLSQLDASLYTPLFVASDGGVNPEQKIYQTQARSFYGEAVTYLDRFLDLVPPETLERAKKAADQARYEIRVDKN